MPVESGVGRHGDLSLDCKSSSLDVGDTVGGGDEVQRCGGDDWLGNVGLGECDSDGSLAGEDLGFSHAVAAEVAGVVDREVRGCGIVGEGALQGRNLLIKGLDAEQGDACGIDG